MHTLSIFDYTDPYGAPVVIAEKTWAEVLVRLIETAHACQDEGLRPDNVLVVDGEPFDTAFDMVVQLRDWEDQEFGGDLYDYTFC